MDVVISGIGGRFPRSRNVKEFSDNLLAGQSLLEPARRWPLGAWDTHKEFGHTDSLSTFDYTFFGVHYDLAKSADAMMRVAIETAFEAVVDAGICPTTLRGTNAAVFTAAIQAEGDCFFSEFIKGKGGYVIVGRNRCMFSNRISYCLDLTGRSSSYDASSGWIGAGLKMAREAIISGECDTVFVNSLSMMCILETNKVKQSMGLLSADGSIHPFDVEVNGANRGEAQITFLVQRADIAKRSYGTIVAAGAETQGFLPNWFLSVNEEHLENFVTSLYQENGLDPNDVKILEADGQALKDLVEPELNVLDRVLNSKRPRDSPLYLGSVKTITGDTEGSAGHTGLTKLILAMETGIISPTLGCGKLNPNIPGLINHRYEVVTKPTTWEVTSNTLVALSNLSNNGVVSHVVLRAHGKAKDPNVKKDYSLPYLVLLSSRKEDFIYKALKEVTSSPFDPEYLRLTQEVFAPTISKFEWRGYGFHGQEEFVVQRENRRPVWFVYSGMGSQWPGMGKFLLEFPVAKETLQRLHRVLEAKGVDLLRILTSSDPAIFDNILHSFIGIASVQVALTNLLKKLGIKFDGLIGHSVGELGCSYADGCLTEEQTILAAYERGMASLKADLIPGLMAAVGLGYTQAKDLLPPDVFVACRNSRESCTISGPTESVKNVISSFNAKNIFVRGVNVSNIAYHSPYIRPAAPYLHEALRKVIPSPKPRSEKWICTSAPKEKWDTDEVRYCSADYHTNNLLNPVLFEEGSAYIPKNALLIEIAPHGLLQAILKRSLSNDVVSISLTRRNAEDPAKLLLKSIGKMFLEGESPQIWHLYPDVSIPVSRNTPSLTPLLEWDHSEIFPNLTNPEPKTKELVHALSLTSPNVEIKGEKCLLLSYALVMVWMRFADLLHKPISEIPVVFENVRFYDVIRVEEQGGVDLGLLFLPTTGLFDITRNEVLIAQGVIRVLDEVKDIPVKLPDVSDIVEFSLDSNDVYSEMKSRCVGVPENVKTVKSLQFRPHDWTAEVTFDEDWIILLNSLCTLFQLKMCEKNQDSVFITRIRHLTIDPTVKGSHDSTARLHIPSMTLTYRGVTLSDLSFRPFKELKPRAEPVSLRFVPFGQTKLREAEKFLHHVVQLSLEKPNDSRSTFKIYDAVGKCSVLIPKLFDILKTDFSTKCETISDAKDANLIVCDPEFCDDLTKPIFTYNGLFLTRGGHKFRNDFSKSSVKGDIKIIAECGWGETSDSLIVLSNVLPPLNPVDCKIFKMKPQDVFCDSITDSFHSLIILVWENGTTESIEKIYDEVLTKGFSQKIRLVFLMTRNSPPFSLTLPLYADRIRLNISVNVYLDGNWGSYHLIPLLKRSLWNGSTGKLGSVNSPVRVELDFSDSGRSTGTAQINSSCSKAVVGYAVEYKNGDRIMGIGRCVDRSSQHLIPDPFLKWSTPLSWSLQDAAIVPNTFATAYLALMEVSQLIANEIVVVDCPFNPVGQAAIHIANSVGCITIALLKSQQEKKQFQKFPLVKPHHIIVSDSGTSVYSIKKVAPGGVHVVVSDSNGKALTAFSRILTGTVLARGRYLQIGEDVMHKGECMGMYSFTRPLYVEGITHEKVVNASEEVKRKVVEWMKEGLKTGVVVPLSIVKEGVAMTEGLRTSNRTGPNINGYREGQEEEVAWPTALLESQNQKCLIVGGSPAQWIRISYCLARKGYKLIALLPGKQSLLPNLFIRHSRILHADYATELRELKTFDQSQNSDNGVLHDIFIFGRTSFAEDVSRLLDSKSLKDTRVTFFSCGSTQFSRKCDRWNRDGLKVRAALSVEDVPLDNAELYLDWILSPAAPPVSVLNRFAFSAPSWMQGFTEADFLPASTAELQTLGALIRRSNSPMFRKLVTRCSDRPTCEVRTMFFIKGVHGTATSDLEKLGANLLAPLVEITLQADCGSLDVVAQEVVRGIRKMQGRGPYNLAGDPVRTDVVLRVARILQDNGYATVVFLENEKIENVRQGLKLLLEDNRLGESVLKFSLGGSFDPKDWKTVNWSWMAWPEQVEAAVSRIPGSDPNTRDDISAALHHIYDSVLHITDAPGMVTLDHGVVHLLKDGDDFRMRQWGDRLYEHTAVSLKMNPEGVADVISQNLATPCMQLELDKARRTGLS